MSSMPWMLGSAGDRHIEAAMRRKLEASGIGENSVGLSFFAFIGWLRSTTPGVPERPIARFTNDATQVQARASRAHRLRWRHASTISAQTSTRARRLCPLGRQRRVLGLRAVAQRRGARGDALADRP